MGLTTTEITSIVAAISFVGMLWFLTNRGRANLAQAKADAEPAIAGADIMDGAAKKPEQFDEPSLEALEEMAALLGEEE
ncbi:MAG: hypothetical protein QGG96_03060 [Candidatus Poseidoniaceae archaeon]|jgi:hypothetical protein|nr:hypothetical protein [Candidatus Poseidoniaceae archaeon]